MRNTNACVCRCFSASSSGTPDSTSSGKFLDGDPGARPARLRPERTEHRAGDERRGLRPVQIPDGKRLRPQQRARIPAAGTGAGRPVDDVHDRSGYAARPGAQAAGHLHHGGPELPRGLVQRNGLASVRPRHDPLVLDQGARHEDVDLELRPQRRRGFGRPDGRLRRHLVRLMVLRQPHGTLFPDRNLSFPAVVAIFIAILAYVLIRDTPQSCSLPSVEKWRNDYPKITAPSRRKCSRPAKSSSNTS